MATLDVVNASAQKVGTLDVSDDLFDQNGNSHVVWEVVRHHLASLRSGTHATKTRGDVRGGGRKPWRQKGTGRARHGSRRSPIWSGGGITFGPHPRSHAYPLSQAVRHLAVRSLLADRARDSRVIVVERLRL